MIFVTVGTTHFDELIRQVDALVETGRIRDRVVCQIGAGKYVPSHAESFRFAPSLDEWFSKADLVVTHGGATVLSLLQRRQRFVAIANTALAGDHQSTLLARLARSADLKWSRNVDDLGPLVEAALASDAPRLNLPRVADAIRACILGNTA